VSIYSVTLETPAKTPVSSCELSFTVV